jgi:hypothetical protein
MDRFPEKKKIHGFPMVSFLIFLQAAPCIERDDQRVRRHLEASRHPGPIRSKGDIVFFKDVTKMGMPF